MLKVNVFFNLLQWVTLEDVKSGMIHLELTWFSLMDDPVMLKMVNWIESYRSASCDYWFLVFVLQHAAETQSMGLSSALLIVYVDSATSLPVRITRFKLNPSSLNVIIVFIRAPGHLQNPILMWSWLPATVASKLQLGCVLAIPLGSRPLSSSSAIPNQTICI